MTEAEAIERARHEADARLWPWVEPVMVQRKRRLLLGPVRWRVKSNSATAGLHVVVVMTAEGRVLRANVLRH